MTNYKIWKENIYNSIKDFSDIESQKKIWMGKAPGLASSFDEDICMLYDDNCFGDIFWEEKNLYEFHFTPNLTNELKKLKNIIDKYSKKQKLKDLTDEEILKDPNWIKVVNQAKRVIEVWGVS